jgi:Ion channel
VELQVTHLVWICLLLLLGTTVLHYEALNVASRIVGRPRVHHRLAVLLLVLGLACTHGAEMTVYALTYYLEREHFGLGTAAGGYPTSFASYLYFSAETYTSLGFGDLVPKDGLRFLAGLEALNGLLLIGWSGSFIFLVMQKIWNLNATSR